MTPPRVEVLRDFAREAAAVVAGELAAIQRGGAPVTLALSGGGTPRGVFAELVKPPLRTSLDWARVSFFWVDERCVPPGHPESNFGMAQSLLLQPLGVAAERVHRMEGERGAEDAARYYDEMLGRLAPGGLDLLLMGLGADGHTASLFPGSPALEASARAAAARSPAGQDRVTLTFPYMGACRRMIMLVAGAGKAAPARRALAGDASLPAGRLAVRQSAVWLLDEAAAGR